MSLYVAESPAKVAECRLTRCAGGGRCGSASLGSASQEAQLSFVGSTAMKVGIQAEALVVAASEIAAMAQVDRRMWAVAMPE